MPYSYSEKKEIETPIRTLVRPGLEILDLNCVKNISYKKKLHLICSSVFGALSDKKHPLNFFRSI